MRPLSTVPCINTERAAGTGGENGPSGWVKRELRLPSDCPKSQAGESRFLILLMATYYPYQVFINGALFRVDSAA
jgi:hypothetical protein